MPEKTSNKQHPNIKAQILPHNDEAEQAVLGCVMIDEYAPITVLNELKSEDFYQKANAKIFEAMYNVFAATKPIDIITLVQECEAMGIMEEVGGINYLSSLTNVIPSADNFKYYMDIVKSNSVLRKLIRGSSDIIDKAYSMQDKDEAIHHAERIIYDIAEHEERSTLTTIKDATTEAVKELEDIYNNPNGSTGIPIEYKKLNSILNGFHPTDLVVIGARPGEGKTSLGMNFISYAALHGNRKTESGNDAPYKCAVFSLEMSARQIANRLLCAEARVDMSKAMSGKLDINEWKRIHDAQARINKAQIYIDDNAQTTPTEILSKCRRLKREKGLDMVLVDYLQLMTSGKNIDSRQQDVSEISRTMKIAAKELEVPILLLSQLNREVGKRIDHRPQLTDLRESGSIEQDADIILFIYRKYDSRDMSVPEEERNSVEIQVAKHRNGELGNVPVRWVGAYTSFVDEDTSKTTKEAENFMPKGDGGKFIMGDDVPFEEDDGMPNLAEKTTIKAENIIDAESFGLEEVAGLEEVGGVEETLNAPDDSFEMPN